MGVQIFDPLTSRTLHPPPVFLKKLTPQYIFFYMAFCIFEKYTKSIWQNLYLYEIFENTQNLYGIFYI
jgi:hypothetical protein